MIWIAITIVIAGFIIAQVISQHNKRLEELKQKELELKKQELESNPEYRKKIALEQQVENYHSDFEMDKEQLRQDEQRLAEAKQKQDKEAIARYERMIEQDRKEMKTDKERMWKFKQQLEGIDRS